MRGTPLQETHRPRPNGIIPAYAGNTDQSIILFPSCGDHPRVCGEHYQLRGCRNRSRDHPRVCGEHLPIDTGEMLNARDHPRVCGEHSSRMLEKLASVGSSPRMRGTHQRTLPTPARTGIIPAYAGNTSETPRNPPRGGGSSPRMRGTRPFDRVRAFDRGIIPAYAGNTSGEAKNVLMASDHPRVCGEHAGSLASNVGAKGSSPRMRGTLAVERDLHDRTGIIPAYAGNTKRWTRQRSSRWGSSPRMRGTPYACRCTRRA